MKKEAPPLRGRLSLILQIIHCFSCRLYSLFLILFYGFFFFRLKVNLIEFEFRFGHGSGRSVYSPSEYVQQIDDRYGVETFIYDDSLCRIGWSLGFHDRFVESTSDFGRVFLRCRCRRSLWLSIRKKRWRRRSSKEMSTRIFRNISLYGEYVPCPCGWVGLGT